MLLLGCKGLSRENIFPGGGGEEGGTELLGTQKMGMYFQTGYGLQSPEFNIGCKIFLSGLEAFSRGCELATCDICVHYL